MANHQDGMSSIEDLRLAVAIADHGSLLAAAASLHIAQPSASQRLRRIEARVGVDLFDRDTRGTRPTTAGMEYVRLARHALTTVESVATGARRAVGVRRSRVGTFTSLSVPVFTAVHRMVPRLTTVEQRIGNGRQLLRMIEEGELDAAIVIAAHAVWSPTAAEVARLGGDPLLLIAPAGTEPANPDRGRRSRWPAPVWLASYSSQPEDVAQMFAAMGATVHRAGSAPVALAIARERGELAAVPRTAWSMDRRPGEQASTLSDHFSMPLALVTLRTSPLAGRGAELAAELGLNAEQGLDAHPGLRDVAPFSEPLSKG